MSNYQFEPHYDEENGWYCRKLVYMSSAEEYGQFNSQGECEDACKLLNQIDYSVYILSKYCNIKLEVREVK